MKKGMDDDQQRDPLIDEIAGLGERSLRKSHYPALKAKIRDLDQQRTLFRSTLNAIPDGVVVTGPDGRIIQCNPALCRMFDYTGEELAGREPTLLYEAGSQVFCHDDFPTARCRRFVRRDGTGFLGEIFDSEICNDHGEFLGNLQLIRDLSEQAAALRQQQHLEDQLRQSQKMAAIGTLAGGIAHDFNNLLAAMLGYAELALLKLPADTGPAREIRQIVTAGTKAAELVSQILAFSRKETTERIPVQPAGLLKEAIKLLRGTIPTTITIRERISAPDQTILANPGQLHQVVMNLCTNAFHAMEERGGEMVLSLAPAQTTLRENEGERECIRISVADNGPGMQPEVLTRIFEPYFTTKPSGKGTGMGLSVVHGIVANHEGRVEVESRPGDGTTFHVYFPVIAAEKTALPSAAASPLAGGRESILVVDDEQMVAGYLREFLQQLGYRVTLCKDGYSALELFERNPQQFDLVITDQTMPGRTGFDLARTMLALRPSLPVILCSGYSSALSPERVKRAGIRKFMMKPVTLNELAPVIRALLDNPE